MSLIFPAISLTLCIFGILTVLPLWYLLVSRKFLHVNFRTITLMTTAGAQLAQLYSLVDALCHILDHQYTGKFLLEHVKPITRYGGVLYYIGFFFLGLERAAAVFMVSKYEKCVSSAMTVTIAIVLLSVSGFVGTILNMLVATYGTSSTMVFVTVYVLLCFTIAVSLIVYRRSAHGIKHGSSLQRRFQDKENGRTLPIYTYISANELLVSVAISSVFAALSNSKRYSEGTRTILLGLIDVLDGYRISFFNVVVLCNWFIWKRNRRQVSVDFHTNGDQHFRDLQTSWNSLRAPATAAESMKSLSHSFI
ncbi:hypothetical protein V3C99_007530 [Haemonchus contortus]